MTPLQIQMLLHAYACAAPFEGREWPAQQDAVRYFQAEKLIEVPTNIDRLVLTDRGAAYVAFLCQLPLPACKWSIPEEWAPTFPMEEGELQWAAPIRWVSPSEAKEMFP